MKKAISLLLILALLCAFAPAALAADETALAAADSLHALGLFNGAETDAEGKPVYELDRAPTRFEAITMLVRLLGKEAEAKAGTWDTPFTDLVPWAEPYVGYAYENGLTNGTGETTFSGSELVTATQYLTFVLRALGYVSGTDFRWDAAWELTDRLGIMHGEYNDGNNKSFLRADVALVSRSALAGARKEDGTPLAQKLIMEGVFTAELYESVMKGEGIEPAPAADEYSPDTVYRKLIAMKEELPEGLPWSNNDEYVLKYSYEENGRTINMTYYGYGCVAFALRVNSAAFGDLPIKTLERGQFTFEQLRPGDMLRINNDTHTVLVLEVREDSVVIAPYPVAVAVKASCVLFLILLLARSILCLASTSYLSA